MKKILYNTTAPGRKARRSGGFTLVELLIASAVFMLIAGAAFTLFASQSLSSQVVQGQVGLNLALRNAATQLQVDLANAGSYYYQGVNVPSWPVGVSIVNNWVSSGSSCYTASTNTYGASCFDKINIIAAANPATYPAINVTDHTGGTSPSTNCSNTRTGSGSSPAVPGTAWGLAAPVSTYFPSGLSLAATAATFLQGDQILFVTAGGNQMTSVVLTANASVVGSAIKFTFNPTLVQTVSGVTYSGYNSVANDPLGITTCNGDSPCPAAAQPATGQVTSGLGEQYCYGDWIIKLAPITYQVSTANSADPTLTRTVAGGTPVTVMEQVIGFKVGAAIWNSPTSTDGTDLTPCPSGTGICPYNYEASTYNISGTGGTYDNAYNFTLVRAVRISLIGRTVPSTDPSYKFRNAFDNGPYQVQGTAVVVNPRDLSMNDN
ncbi:MAG: prepilin-type N-terminal cleavage/methylation domain-containing protein [Terriglobales bacterium]